MTYTFYIILPWIVTYFPMFSGSSVVSSICFRHVPSPHYLAARSKVRLLWPGHFQGEVFDIFFMGEKETENCLDIYI